MGAPMTVTQGSIDLPFRRAIARAEVSAYLSRDETRPRDRGPTAFGRRVERAACSQAPDRVCS